MNHIHEVDPAYMRLTPRVESTLVFFNHLVKSAVLSRHIYLFFVTDSQPDWRPYTEVTALIAVSYALNGFW